MSSSSSSRRRQSDSPNPRLQHALVLEQDARRDQETAELARAVRARGHGSRETRPEGATGIQERG